MYKEIAEQVLKDKNPQDYHRMKNAGTLHPFLASLERDYNQEELSRMADAIEAAPKEPYLKRAQEIEMAKHQIQEILISQLVEQLSVPVET